MGRTAASSGWLAELLDRSMRARCIRTGRLARANLQLSEQTLGAGDQHSRWLLASEERS